MFYIDSSKQKPNHALMFDYAMKWAERGFMFDKTIWRDLLASESEKLAELQALGLKNPNSPKQTEWFLRSFNSLEICGQLYDTKCAKWDLSVDALCELADKFNSIPELQVLFEYRKASATARVFKTLERQLTDGNKAHPKVKRTLTNRIVFSEPPIIGLPKKYKPFLPTEPDSVLVSVDVKTQEPNIIVNWFGSAGLKGIIATEADIYTGVVKAAFTPRLKAYQGAGHSVSRVGKGGKWLWGTGDALLYIEDVYQAVFGLPPLVTGVFESGATRKLPVKWLETNDGVTVGELLPNTLSYRLLPEERAEAKNVWQIMAYGGAMHTAISACKNIDGETLVHYLKTELKTQLSRPKGGVYTYFETPLTIEKKTNQHGLKNYAVQGTGADLMALLVERFYAETRPAGVDIYFTRYDELILQVSKDFIRQMGGNGVGDYFREVFEHKVDDFTPFRVDVELF